MSGHDEAEVNGAAGRDGGNTARKRETMESGSVTGGKRMRSALMRKDMDWSQSRIKPGENSPMS